MLARIHSEYKSRGVNVVAINFDPRYSLDEWHSFWNAVGAADVILAQDTNAKTVNDYRLVALGTEVVVGRDGRVSFRSDGPAGYERLRSAVDQAL